MVGATMGPLPKGLHTPARNLLLSLGSGEPVLGFFNLLLGYYTRDDSIEQKEPLKRRSLEKKNKGLCLVAGRKLPCMWWENFL